MSAIAKKVDAIRYAWRTDDSGPNPWPPPKGDGTGSPTAVAQAGYHMRFVSGLIEKGAHSWRDLARMRINNLFSVKKPEELQEHILGLMAMLSEWYDEIETRK
jgi:hypothetical protein